MSFMPIAQGLSPDSAKNLCLIATDMDGTLTQRGKFTPTLLQAFHDLAAVGLRVLIVTGRSAGWVSGLASYLPVMGAIAENGGMFYNSSDSAGEPIVAIPDLTAHRQQLAHTFRQLQSSYPHLQESADNRFRITDWTFDVQGLSPEDLQDLQSQCEAAGWSFTYSTVQCHIKPPQQDKALGLEQVMQRLFPDWTTAQVLTVGDSPNDESLFQGDRFPLSVGVANVLHYADQLRHPPAYVTAAAEADGFCELVDWLLWLRSR